MFFKYKDKQLPFDFNNDKKNAREEHQQNWTYDGTNNNVCLVLVACLYKYPIKVCSKRYMMIHYLFFVSYVLNIIKSVGIID